MLTDVFLLPVRFADPSMWAVHVGLTEQPVHGAQSLAVEKIVYHARYRPKGLDYDIALMKLSTALVFNGNDDVVNLSLMMKLSDTLGVVVH